jgi:hypothetical protein
MPRALGATPRSSAEQVCLIVALACEQPERVRAPDHVAASGVALTALSQGTSSAGAGDWAREARLEQQPAVMTRRVRVAAVMFDKALHQFEAAREERSPGLPQDGLCVVVGDAHDTPPRLRARFISRRALNGSRRCSSSVREGPRRAARKPKQFRAQVRHAPFGG